MIHDTRPGRPWRAAIATIVATAVVLGLVAALALGLDIRREVNRTGEPLAAAADRVAATIDPARPARAREALVATGASARLLGPAGRVRLQTGPGGAVWVAGDAGRAGALATAGADGWTLRDGAVEAARDLPTGARVVLRESLPPGAGTVGSAGPPVAGAIALLSLLAGAVAWILGTRRDRRLARLTTAAQALSGGRPAPMEPEGRGGWLTLSRSMASAAERAGVLQTAAEARMEALGAAVAPLSHPVAALTPSGGLIRNDALERLVGGLAAADAAAVDGAVRVGLSSPGPVARRLSLSDGRALEVEGWAVPGGRVVAVGERTEQARMAAVRRQVTGAASVRMGGRSEGSDVSRRRPRSRRRWSKAVPRP